MTATTQIPDGSVIITPTEVYAEVRATREAVSELSRTMTAVPATLDDHERRLRVLERSRWPLPAVGALCGVAGLASTLWSSLGR